MKILVTGSSGLVGSAIRDCYKKYIDEHFFNDEWIFLTSEDGDLTKEANVEKLFYLHKPNVVIHLAANVGGLFKNMNQRAEMYEDNILINTFILKYCRKFKVSKFIGILSTCIFPDGLDLLNEDMLHKGPPHPSNEGYAYAKRMMEVHGRILQTDNTMKVVQLIPTNIYGINDNFNLDNAHVLPALIHRCYLAKKYKQHFVVKGSGKPIRQFIYNKDLAKIILWSIYENNDSGLYICSPPSSEQVTIEQLARKIADNMNYEHALIFDDSYHDGQYKKLVEPHKSFQNMCFTPLNEGLKETIDWFIDNYEQKQVRI